MLYSLSEESSAEARKVLLGELLADAGWMAGEEGEHDPQELAQVVAALALDELRMDPQRIRPTGQDVAHVASEIAGMLHIESVFVAGLAEECFIDCIARPKTPDPELVAMFERLG